MRMRHLVVAGLLTLLGPLAVSPQAWAATASPASITVNCGIDSGVTGATLTGRVGDTVTVQNTSSTGTCTFASYAGVVTATNLTSDVLAVSSTSVITIAAAGFFTITPQGTSSPVAGSFTVIIGDPSPTPEYVVTFDANGGDCSSNPLVITAAAGDWYSAPTDGTGPF